MNGKFDLTGNLKRVTVTNSGFKHDNIITLKFEKQESSLELDLSNENYELLKEAIEIAK